MKRSFFICAVFFQLIILQSCEKADNNQFQTNENQLNKKIKGMDLSLLNEVRQSNVVVKNSQGEEEDMLITAANNGINTIRLRLWKNPLSPTHGFTQVKNLVDEIHSLGLQVLLTVHYSDTWADPGNQQIPALWEGLSIETLKDSVFNYTKRIMIEMQPEYIQIGNEINSGLLHPQGHKDHLLKMKSLLQSGIQAVRATSADTQIILHYAGHLESEIFFNDVANLDYDIIGLSYYPMWHGKDLNAFDASVDRLETNYDKSILLVETAYPFTLDWFDFTNNIIGSENQILTQFNASPQGQKAYFSQLKNKMTSTNQRLGIISWGSEWIAYRGADASNGSPYENQAFWDFNHQALPVFEVFNNN